MIRERISILRIIARLNIGGPAIHAHLLTTGLDPDAFESILVTGRISPHEGDMAPYLFDPLDKRLVVIPELQREIHPVSDLKVLCKIFTLLRRVRPDIVHTHTAKAGTVGRIAALMYRCLCGPEVKIVHTFHGNVFEGYFSRARSWLFEGIERLLAKGTDAIIAISESQKLLLSETHRVAPLAKIRHIELGFDLEPFFSNTSLKGQFRGRMRVSMESLLIGIIGRLVPIKDHRLFLHGARDFLKAYPYRSVQFAVVGDGELRKELEGYCEQLGIKEHVHFCGWIRDIPMVYADLDILALTSINEGTPVSIIEAMASSVPVIATDAGGVRDILGPPEGSSSPEGFILCQRGILCNRGDARGFSNGLKYLAMEDPGSRNQRVENARHLVEKRFSHHRLLRDMAALYGELASQSFSREG